MNLEEKLRKTKVACLIDEHITSEMELKTAILWQVCVGPITTLPQRISFAVEDLLKKNFTTRYEAAESLAQRQLLKDLFYDLTGKKLV